MSHSGGKWLHPIVVEDAKLDISRASGGILTDLDIKGAGILTSEY